MMRGILYCLMTTHYHLLIQTLDANLSRCIRHINGVYTQRYNARHGCDGNLFRGRYKSILIDADSYVLGLVRYIHRNPLRVGIAGKLKDYPWSSHNGYISKAKKWEWLYKNYILDMFSKDTSLQVISYKRFMSTQEPVEFIQHYSKKNMPSILGSDTFSKWVRERFPKKRRKRRSLNQKSSAQK